MQHVKEMHQHAEEYTIKHVKMTTYFKLEH